MGNPDQWRGAADANSKKAAKQTYSAAKSWISWNQYRKQGVI
jgi:hypothetical protein